MFGNCATGRLTIETMPTITVRMAITIATMGRLMKKLDMNLGSFQELWLASSWTMAQGRRSGYAGPRKLPACLFCSASPLAFIGTQMAWVARSSQGEESAAPERRHVRLASVRLG